MCSLHPETTAALHCVRLALSLTCHSGSVHQTRLQVLGESVQLLQIVGVIFPVLIMALVPIRQYILPRIFSQKNLHELDAAEYEEAPPMSHEEVAQEADDGDIELVCW